MWLINSSARTSTAVRSRWRYWRRWLDPPWMTRWEFAELPQINGFAAETRGFRRSSSPDGQIDAIRGHEQLLVRNYVRSRADMLLAQYWVDETIRAAVDRIGRPSSKSYETGELVAFWRDVKKKKGKLLKPGWFRGTVVGPHQEPKLATSRTIGWLQVASWFWLHKSKWDRPLEQRDGQ